MCETEKDVTVRALGGGTDTSARYLTGSNVGSSSSSSDYETQLVPKLQQGNDFRDHSDDARDGAGSGPSDSSDDAGSGRRRYQPE
jgi:hypothetical protein